MKAVAIAAREDPARAVAWLTNEHGRVRAAATAASPALDALITVAAGLRPRRRVREADPAGRIALREEPVSWDEPGSLVAWADAITYSPAARDRFMAWVATELPAAPALTEALPPWYVGALLEAAPARTPRVVCPCGATYVLGTPVCPRCRGADPLASLGPDVGAALRARFEPQVSPPLVPDALVAGAGALAERARRHAALLAAPLPDRATASTADGARAILDEFGRRVALARSIAGEVAALRAAASTAAADTLHRASQSARRVRAGWEPQATLGWRHTRRGVTALHTALVGRWQPAFGALKQVGDAGVVAMARYAPVHRRLKKMTEPAGLVAIVRGVMMAVSAVKTMGVSLAVKGALWAFKEHKAAKALEAFGQALESLRGALTVAAGALELAVATETAAATDRRHALVQHLWTAFAHDYAHAGSQRQEVLAARAGTLLGKRPSGLRRGRGSTNAPRAARIPTSGRRRAMILGGAALALAVAVALIAWALLRA